jgi:hypothetical protein
MPKKKHKRKKPTTKAGQQRKFGTVMREFEAGTLRSSSGALVRKRSQAQAIAASKAGIARKKKKTKAKKG